MLCERLKPGPRKPRGRTPVTDSIASSAWCSSCVELRLGVQVQPGLVPEAVIADFVAGGRDRAQSRRGSSASAASWPTMKNVIASRRSARNSRMRGTTVSRYDGYDCQPASPWVFM